MQNAIILYNLVAFYTERKYNTHTHIQIYVCTCGSKQGNSYKFPRVVYIHACVNDAMIKKWYMKSIINIKENFLCVYVSCLYIYATQHNFMAIIIPLHKMFTHLYMRVCMWYNNNNNNKIYKNVCNDNDLFGESWKMVCTCDASNGKSYRIHKHTHTFKLSEFHIRIYITFVVVRKI